MAKQINPALARLWISEKNRQYGYRRALLLESLTEEENRVLDFLELGISATQFSNISRLAAADEQQTDKLLDRLNPFIWSSSKQISEEDISQRFTEITRILLQQGDPAEVLHLRKQKIVFLEKLDATGLAIARALTAAGIGKMISFDQKRVSEKDITPLGFHKSDLAIPRARVAQRILGNHLEFHSRISNSLDRVHLAVIICSDIVPPKSYQRWLARDIPHIAVCFDEEGVEISPMIVPGKTPCLGCLQLHELQTKPNWPVIAPQLLGLDRDLADAALSLFAAGVIANNALNFLDWDQVSHLATRLERNGQLKSFEPQETNCGCRYPEETLTDPMSN